jgi:hypothetical protein
MQLGLVCCYVLFAFCHVSGTKEIMKGESDEQTNGVEIQKAS